MKKITIDIELGGQVRIEAHNFKGADCEQATKFISEALGGDEPVGKGRKPEYHNATGAQAKAGA